MRRTSIVFLGAPALLLLSAGTAFAADPLGRGPGFYISWWKLLLVWILFAIFVKSAAWLNKDCQEVGERYGLDTYLWNTVFVFTFLAIFLLGTFAVPIFAAGYPVAWLGLIIPLWIYIAKRNAAVLEDERVMTPKHIAHWFANLGKREKKVREVRLPHEMGSPVNFVAKGATNEQDNQANLIQARQLPGYIPAKDLIAAAFDARADRVMLDYTRDAVSVRHEIDGVWQNANGLDRENGDALLAVLKKISARDPNERRARQQGLMGVAYKEFKMDAELVTQGTQTGERVVLKFERGISGLDSLERLGMRDKMRERLAGYLRGDQGGGMILISAMPGGGFTSTWCAMLRSTDRLLRDFTCIEEQNVRTPYIENIEMNKFNAAAGESPDKLMPKLLLKQPDVFVLPDLYNAETVRMLCREVNEENRLVIAGVRSKESVEALLRVLLLKAPAEEFAQAVKAVLNVRLIRKLSETCKQPYQPPAQLLQRLGIPPGRVKELYKEWQPTPDPEKKKIPPEACEFCGLMGPTCHGLGYVGRTGIFELLEVDDKLRQALVKQPKLEVLRQVARQQGHRGLQEEGVLLVAQGLTSLNELQRVLKT
jgi:type II secretory ATPase GspE/PulE/Tfp pilus assembly ATPase PilB-like protein